MPRSLLMGFIIGSIIKSNFRVRSHKVQFITHRMCYYIVGGNNYAGSIRKQHNDQGLPT